MPWTPQTKQQFQQALLDAFRSKATLKQMVAFGMGENLDAIAGDGNLQDVVFSLIDWADGASRLEELVQAAKDANPTNARLKTFTASLAQPATGGNGAGTPPSASGGDGGSTSASGSRPESAGAVAALPTLGPADPPPIAIEDQEKLRSLLVEVFTFKLPNGGDRRNWLKTAGFSTKWIGGFVSLDSGPVVAATELVNQAASQGQPVLSARPGYKILGIILNQLLADEYVDLSGGRYLASLISRYQLIDTTRSDVQVSPLLGGLLQIVPQFTGEAEAAVRALVGFNAFLDASWLDKGAAACRAVCRIETPAKYGTGFLVGPDLVLTNYHVMQEVMADPQTAGQVVLRFGFKRKMDDTIDNDGAVYTLKKDGWLIDSSPNVPGSLDYALLRLGAPAGKDTVDNQPRGALRPIPHQFQSGEDLYIIQHPQFQPGPTEPLKVVLAPNAVTEASADGTRVRYETNTEPGSSGSPCFTRKWELVALHHSNFDAHSNEGIPLDTICARPKVKQALGL